MSRGLTDGAKRFQWDALWRPMVVSSTNRQPIVQKTKRAAFSAATVLKRIFATSTFWTNCFHQQRDQQRQHHLHQLIKKLHHRLQPQKPQAKLLNHLLLLWHRLMKQLRQRPPQHPFRKRPLNQMQEPHLRLRNQRAQQNHLQRSHLL